MWKVWKVWKQGHSTPGYGSDRGGSKADIKGFPTISVTFVPRRGVKLRRHGTEKTTPGREFTPLASFVWKCVATPAPTNKQRRMEEYKDIYG